MDNSQMFKSKPLVLFICVASLLILTHFVHKKYTRPLYFASDLTNQGGLANQIFSYASFYGISKYLGRKPVIYTRKEEAYGPFLKNMREFFPKLYETIEIRDEKIPETARSINFAKTCCSFTDPKELLNMPEEIIVAQGNANYQSWKYFHQYRDEVIGSIANRSAFNFGNLPNKTETNKIVCAHTRRTDFLRGFHASQKNFTQDALKWIVKKTGSGVDTKIVVFGDDPKFKASIIEAFDKKNSFVSQNNRFDDLGYAQYNCDVVLITAPASTFGWWLGYLSLGQEVYYMNIKETNDFTYKTGINHPDDFYLPFWTPLSYKDGIVQKIVL